MSYKQFIQELEDDILPAEAERRYILESKISSNSFFSDHLLVNLIEFCLRIMGVFGY